MADFVAAPPVPSSYPRLAALTAQEIAEAGRCGYISDHAGVADDVSWSCSDPLKFTSAMVEHGNNSRAWRGKLYLIWFCYVFENLKAIRRPLFAIEELFLHFQSNLIDDLAQMFAGCGAWDETITPEDWVRIGPKLQKYHARAVELLGSEGD
jgi:hypothetical protein